MRPQILLMNNIRDSSSDGDAHKVAQFGIDPQVALVLLFHILEFKVVADCVFKLAWAGKFLPQRQEFVMISSVVIQFYSGLIIISQMDG